MTSFDWLALMIFINVKILTPHVANKVTMGNGNATFWEH